MTKLVPWLLFVVACGSSPGTPAQPKTTQRDAGLSCATTAARLIATVSGIAPPRTANQRREYDAMRGAIAKRCAEDAWSVEVRSCWAQMDSAAAADRCEAMLTPEQRDKMNHTADALDQDQDIEEAPPVPHDVSPTDGKP